MSKEHNCCSSNDCSMYLFIWTVSIPSAFPIIQSAFYIIYDLYCSTRHLPRAHPVPHPAPIRAGAAQVWGGGVSLAIYATAGASGAHLNPAITLAFQLATRRMEEPLRFREMEVWIGLDSFGLLN